jgi:transformation/transcription domain-associated protein
VVNSFSNLNCCALQTLLASIGLCQPQPKVPSELIRFLGKTYCAWHNATWMLEQHVMIFPQDPRCFDALVCT